VRTALATGTPQLRSKGNQSFGAFPFQAQGVQGCVQVSIARALFHASEVTFLRFLATLCGTVIGNRLQSGVAAAAAESSGPPDAPARRYVAMAAHDLRNPLNVVAGYAELLNENNLGALTPEQQEAVRAISRQCKTLLSTVDQLIELDRLASGSGELQVSQFLVRTLFDDVRSLCFPQSNGSIRWPGAEAAFDFQSDRRRIFSIVQNLVDNSIKHATGSEVVVDCTRAAGNLVIDVRDEGPGLDAELRAKIVAQAQTGSEIAPRSGLGLYAVASYVHALGGTLSVESGPTKGTTFHVVIPGKRPSLVATTRVEVTSDSSVEP
jgi:signal transduction histidine kinase